MSPIEVQQAAQFAKLHRIIATVRRMDGKEALAREADKQARKHETMLRDFATECELSPAQA